MTYRTAFVTGASSGIGLALARRLGRAGVEVALAARRAEILEEVAKDIRREGGHARVYPLDVTRPHDVVETLRRADDDVEGLDLVIANAGVGAQRWAGKLQWSRDIEPLIAVNVIGATATLTALLERMTERGKGHIVGISSLAQYRGLPRGAVYSASKAFLSTFLEGVRVDVRHTGVTVTDVRPGFVRTPIVEGNTHPMPMIMQPEAAAEIIWRGIETGSPVVAFPWPLAMVVRSSTLLPARIYDRIIGRAKG